MRGARVSMEYIMAWVVVTLLAVREGSFKCVLRCPCYSSDLCCVGRDFAQCWHVALCVCVCACVRACVRACVSE